MRMEKQRTEIVFGWHLLGVVGSLVAFVVENVGGAQGGTIEGYRQCEDQGGGEGRFEWQQKG